MRQRRRRGGPDPDGYVRLFKLPDTQVCDFLGMTLLARGFVSARVTLEDEDELFEFSLDFRSLASLWAACPRADWMLWMVEQAAAWKLVPKAIADAVLDGHARVADEPLDVQADILRKTVGNPFAFMNEKPLIERRTRVDYCVREGNGPVVPRITAMFRPTIH